MKQKELHKDYRQSGKTLFYVSNEAFPSWSMETLFNKIEPVGKKEQIRTKTNKFVAKNLSLFYKVQKSKIIKPFFITMQQLETAFH
jgi:hypothetical protein